MNPRNLLALTVLSLTALSLGSAAAETTPTEPTPPPASSEAPTPTSTPLPGMVSMGAAWTAFVGAGTADLLSADGGVVGTVNADGSVTLNDGVALTDVKAVQLTPADGGKAVVYTFTRDLSRPGAIKVAVTGPNGKTLSLPLPAVLHRAQKAVDASAKTQETDATDTDDGDDGDAATAKASTGSSAPAKGKGKGSGHK